MYVYKQQKEVKLKKQSKNLFALKPGHEVLNLFFIYLFFT